MQSYNQPSISVDEQISLLQSEGLFFSDEERARHLLQNISMFRLKSYLKPFRQHQSKLFKPNASFENAYIIYKFDSELRKMIGSELEKIEISIRTQLSMTMSGTAGIYWFTDATNFRDDSRHASLLGNLGEELRRSDDDAVEHFRRNYTNIFPPSWMTLEVSSFGTLSLLFKHLNGGRTKRSIANYYGVADTVLESWIHSFVYVRNICAHHSRLWNKTLRVTGGFPKKTSHAFIETRVPNDKVYYVLCIIRYMLLTINPNSSFTTRLINLLQDYPSVDTRAMGFPVNWQKEPLWQTVSK